MPQSDSRLVNTVLHRIEFDQGSGDELHWHLLASVSEESVAFDLDDGGPIAFVDLDFDQMRSTKSFLEH